jgi:DNA mismatch endonuclease (patch repair protein)
MVDSLTPEQRTANMAAIRSSGTAPEQRLEQILRRTFPRRRLIQQSSLPGKPDYYLPGLKLAVFLDGCFWHCCPRHGRTPSSNEAYWEPKLAANRRRDRKVTRMLKAQGVQVVRVWEHEVHESSSTRLATRLQGAAERSSGSRKAGVTS